MAVFYGSMYGDTENAVNILTSRLAEAGVKNIAVYDVSSTHVSTMIAEVFRCSHLVLAAPTYNNGVYPAMLNLLHDMKALNLQNRTVTLMENGSWAPSCARQMRALLEEMKSMEILEPVVTLKSALKDDSLAQLDALLWCIVRFPYGRRTAFPGCIFFAHSVYCYCYKHTPRFPHSDGGASFGPYCCVRNECARSSSPFCAFAARFLRRRFL